MDLITVYTQAYNTEKYIRQCIESVLKQTHKSIQYILLDNASTDGTAKIIKEYANLDNRIKYLHHDENKRGVMLKYLKEYAKGKYVTTLDSDDYWEPEFIEKSLAIMKNNDLDVVAIGSNFLDKDNICIGKRESKRDLIFSNKEYPNYFMHSYQFFRTVWGKLYKTDLIFEIDENLINGKLFNGMVYGEDTIFCLSYLRCADGIGISKDILHNYRVHSSSASYKFNYKRFESDIFLLKYAKEILSQYGEISEDNNKFIFLVYSKAILDSLNVIFESSLMTIDKFNAIRQILTHPLTIDMYKILKDNENMKIFKKTIFPYMKQLLKKGVDRKKILDIFSYINDKDTILLEDKTYSSKIFQERYEDILEAIFLGELESGLKKISDLDTQKELITLELNILKKINPTQYMCTCFKYNKDKRIAHKYKIPLLIKKELEKNKVLENLNLKIISEYSDIIEKTYNENYEQALEEIVTIFLERQNVKHSICLIELGVLLASLIEHVPAFIFLQKQKIKTLAKEGKSSEANEIFEEYSDFISDDEDMLSLRNTLIERLQKVMF